MSSKSWKSAKKQAISATLASIIFPTRSLNKVVLDNYNRPNRIVQMNVLHVIYSVIVIEIFDEKVVYEIYPRVYKLRHSGMHKT